MCLPQEQFLTEMKTLLISVVATAREKALHFQHMQCGCGAVCRKEERISGRTLYAGADALLPQHSCSWAEGHHEQ